MRLKLDVACTQQLLSAMAAMRRRTPLGARRCDLYIRLVQDGLPQVLTFQIVPFGHKAVKRDNGN